MPVQTIEIYAGDASKITVRSSLPNIGAISEFFPQPAAEIKIHLPEFVLIM